MTVHRMLIAIMAIATLAFAGCDDDDEVRGTGTVEGRVESTTAASTALLPSRASFAVQAAVDAAASASVGEFTSAGEFRTLATGEVTADGEFTVMDVPAGQARLVAQVEDAAGASVGRSIIHQEVDADAVTTVAPIDGETTTEANVFAELRAGGQAAADVATTELAAKVDFESDATATAAATSEAEIAALATAFQSSERVFLDAMAEIEGETVSAGALQELGDDAAAQLALTLDAGGSEVAAERAYLTALAQAYANAGLGFDAQSEAGSAASTSAFQSTTSGTARLAALRGSARQMAAARAQLAISGLTALGASSAETDAVVDAHADLDASLNAATSANDVLDAFDSFQGVVLAQLRDAAATELGIGAATFIALETALATASFRDTLVASIDASSTTDAIVDAYLDFWAALRDTVEAALTAAGATDVEAEAAADVVVASDAALVL